MAPASNLRRAATAAATAKKIVERGEQKRERLLAVGRFHASFLQRKHCYVYAYLFVYLGIPFIVSTLLAPTPFFYYSSRDSDLGSSNRLFSPPITARAFNLTRSAPVEFGTSYS